MSDLSNDELNGTGDVQPPNGAASDRAGDKKDGETPRPSSNRDDCDDKNGFVSETDVMPEPEDEGSDAGTAQAQESPTKASTGGRRGERATVLWQPTNTAQSVVDTDRALMTAALPIYDFAGRPALVCRAGSLQTEAAEKLQDLTPQRFTLLLSATIRFVELRAGTLVEVPVPAALVRAMMASPSSPFPQLNRMVQIPTLLPDKRLIVRPGFDELSGIYYAETPGLVVPVVSMTPTRSNVHAALTLLSSMACDMLFADPPADLAAMLAAFMTPIVRSAIPGCVPAMVISATTPRVGKTEGVQFAALTATGELATVEVFGSDDEVEKRITGHVKNGDSLIVFDNVARRIGGAPIEAAVTSPWWRGRKLRTNDFYTGRMTATVFFTGNRLTYHEDMLGRVVVVKLATDIEHVSERPLRRPDAKAWVLANRGELIAAVLTICRAHMAAGSPDMGLKPMRGFDDWSRVVRSALVWTGTADPLQNLVALKQEADIEKKALGIALKCLDAIFPGERYFTAKQVATALSGPLSAQPADIDMAEFRDALRVVLGTAPTNLGPVQFGQAWSKLQDRNVGGLVMKLARDGNEGKVYKVVRITSK